MEKIYEKYLKKKLVKVWIFLECLLLIILTESNQVQTHLLYSTYIKSFIFLTDKAMFFILPTSNEISTSFVNAGCWLSKLVRVLQFWATHLQSLRLQSMRCNKANCNIQAMNRLISMEKRFHFLMLIQLRVNSTKIPSDSDIA